MAPDPRLNSVELLALAAMRARERQGRAPRKTVTLRVLYYDGLGIEEDEEGPRYPYEQAADGGWSPVPVCQPRRTALSKAVWSEARSWARDVQAFDHEPPHGRDKFAAVEPFFRTVSPPARVVAVVESLVQEQLLTRQQAIIISSSCSVVRDLV